MSPDLRWYAVKLPAIYTTIVGLRYRILVVYRIIVSWKHGVLGYWNLIVSWGQQCKLCPGWSHQVIAQGLWAPHVHSPSYPIFPSSITMFLSISATKVLPSNHLFCSTPSIEQRKFISRSLGVVVHLRVSSQDILSATFLQVMSLMTYMLYSLGFLGDNRRSATSSGSWKREDCCRHITREATSTHLIQSRLVMRRDARVEII